MCLLTATPRSMVQIEDEQTSVVLLLTRNAHTGPRVSAICYGNTMHSVPVPVHPRRKLSGIIAFHDDNAIVLNVG